MAMKMLTVDGLPVVAFRTRMVCDIQRNPNYIQRYIGLAGIEIKKATGREYKKYKRTRKNRASVEEQLTQIEMW